MRVAVIGPNLRDQSRGQLHVHNEFCNHHLQMALTEPEYANPQIFEADTRQEVVEEIYPPDQFEYDPADNDDYEAYLNEFYFFPCVKDLKD